ncbi:thioesterase II family protein [Chryseobacterium sp. JK1]|uniref:thioesterase II family protein n=1 Tax=Chryseobacterium sp. JK1 TaxID=874294 RepID=UPI003D68ED86
MKYQLFLLHFAGGSVYSFDFLKKYIKPNIEFIPLELPGRGKRFSEELLKNKKEAIKDYVIQIKALRNNKPYLIFGHSMGATLGLSVVEKMEKNGDQPEALIVSGNPGPGIQKEDNTKRYLLEDAEFKIVLKELGGIPDEVLENEELYEFFSPIIRADFEVLENDNFSEKEIRLNTSLYGLMGDEEETCDRLENWRNFTNADFQFKICKGNHFFINEHAQELAKLIEGYFTHVIVK